MLSSAIQTVALTPVKFSNAISRERMVPSLSCAMGVEAELVISGGKPVVVLKDREGQKELGTYPLRNRRSDEHPQTRFQSDECNIRVAYPGTSLEIDVRQRGFAGIINRLLRLGDCEDSWIAFDRELAFPNEVTIVGPRGHITKVEIS